MRVEIQLCEYVNSVIMHFQYDDALISHKLVCDPIAVRNEIIKVIDFEINRKLAWSGVDANAPVQDAHSLFFSILYPADRDHYGPLLSGDDEVTYRRQEEFKPTFFFLEGLLHSIGDYVDFSIPNRIWNHVTTYANQYFYMATFGDDVRVMEYERLKEIEEKFNRLLAGEAFDEIDIHTVNLNSFNIKNAACTLIKYGPNSEIVEESKDANHTQNTTQSPKGPVKFII